MQMELVHQLQQHQVAPQLQLLGMQSEINFINVTQSIYVKVIKLVIYKVAIAISS